MITWMTESLKKHFNGYWRRGDNMPIHTSWKSMIQSMGRQYPGKKVCRALQGGKQVCVSQKAWSVFYATVTKRHGQGAEAKAMPKKVEETLEQILNWFREKRK